MSWLSKMMKFGCMGDSNPDPQVWSINLRQHCYGEFSFATVQSNVVIEDSSQVEIGRNATFVGIYDGHCGYAASCFVRQQLFHHLAELSRGSNDMSEEIIRTAFARTETAFLNHVRERVGRNPTFVVYGTCVLIGFMWQGRLYVANLGDSRAVLGSLDERRRRVSEQLTNDHNVNLESVRQELIALHPNDPEIVEFNNSSWRVKGIVQRSRSIGYAFLKSPEFQVTDPQSHFHVSTPIERPLLSAEPEVLIRVLRSTDRFVIFASDGLWQQINNEEAAEIVHRHSRAGIAKRLVNKAVEVAARKKETDVAEVRNRRVGGRRTYHDDISVVVLFINPDLLLNPKPVPEISILGNSDNIRQTEFSNP